MRSLRPAVSTALILVAAACGTSNAIQPKQPESLVTGPPPSAAASSKTAESLLPKVTKTLDEVGLSGAALNKNVNACEDFYEFACGGWLQSTKIPDDRARWSRGFSEVQQRNEEELHRILDEARTAKGDPVLEKIGAFYGACMDEAGIEKAGTKALDPLLKKAKAVYDVKSLGAAIAELHKHRIWALFDTNDDQDYKDATKVIGVLDQNGLGLPDRDYYVNTDKRSTDLRADYVAHVERMMKLVGFKDAAAKAAAKDVMEIETELAKVSKTKVERRDPKGLYNKIDRAGLVKSAPDFPWDAYFKALEIEKVNDISVTSVPFFEGMNKLLKSIKPAQWQSYLQWHVVRANAGSLSKAFVDESFALEQKLLGTPTQRVRYKRCIESTDAALGDLLAQPFIKTRFGGGSKEAVEGMVAEIGKVFGEQLDQVDWMDAATRERGHKKLKAIAYLIGYPKTWINYTYAVDGKDHAKNTLAAHAFETHRRLDRIGKPLDREAWEMSAPTVNAYYHPNKNHMVFPAGILQPPFYNPKATVAVNMGGMGMVVGHELTHGFDDEGSQFAWNGNLENWWEPPVREKFEKKTGCVVDQYSKYEPLPEAKVDGKLTLGENIADMGGVRLAFEAYRRMRKEAKEQIIADGFTEDQQFFLALGQLWCMKGREEYVRNAVKLDPHSPAKFRVNGPLTNLPAFAKAFQCEPGTKMAPINHCEVW